MSLSTLQNTDNQSSSRAFGFQNPPDENSGHGYSNIRDQTVSTVNDQVPDPRELTTVSTIVDEDQTESSLNDSRPLMSF